MTNDTIDDAELNDLLGGFVNDLGATGAAGNIVLGDRLGFYRGAGRSRTAHAAELADYTGTAERYVREWLRGQAAGRSGDLPVQTPTSTCCRPPRRSPSPIRTGCVLPGAFQMAIGCLADLPEILATRSAPAAASAGASTARTSSVGCERFFRPGYVANLVSSWLPAVDGLVERLAHGIAVADVGCGLGSSTRILAATYPDSTVVGLRQPPRLHRAGRQARRRRGTGRPVRVRGRLGAGLPRQRPTVW